MPSDRQCAGVKADGSPCRSFATTKSGYCAAHDPDPEARAKMDLARLRGNTSSRRKRAERKGGRDPVVTVHPSRLPFDHPPENLDEALALAAWAATAVLTGEIDPRTGQTCAKLVDSFRLALKERDHVAEVQRLKAELHELKKRRGEVPIP